MIDLARFTDPVEEEQNAIPGSAAEDPLVSCMVHARVRGWPPHTTEEEEATHLRLSEALQNDFDGDVHYSAYSRPDYPARLTNAALPLLAPVGGIPMVAMVFDVDCPQAHRATGGNGKEAPDEWFAAEALKVESLLMWHAGGFVYRTRGGYRIVYLLPPGHVMIDDSSRAAWSVFYIRNCVYLHRTFGIVADPACSDWTRLYRAPHATRDEALGPERREVLGDPLKIGIWDEVPAEHRVDGDIAIASELAEVHPSWKSRGLTVLRRLRPKAVRQRPPGSRAAAVLRVPDEDDPTLPDLGTRVDGAMAYIDAMPAAVSGEAGHAATFAVAIAAVRGFALPADVAFVVIAETYNPRCDPPWSDAELQHKVDDADKATGVRGYLLNGAAHPTSRPTIIITTEEHEVVDAAVAALSRDPRVYQRAGGLVHVPIVGQAPSWLSDVGAPRIVRLPMPTLQERLAENARWMVRNPTTGDTSPAHPPRWAVAATEARLSWPGIRPLTAVIETPALRRDGTIVATPGYDTASGLLFVPNAKYLATLEHPTQEEAVAAVAELLAIFKDFPFAAPIHRARVVAAVLGAFARFAYDGSTPMVVMDATTPGVGKNLFLDCISEIQVGRRMARMAQAENEAEERKRITSIAMAGDLQVLIDNVTGPLGSGALDAALTAPMWKERILGTNEMFCGPLLTQFYATGNNVQLRGDTHRRVMMIRLESTHERPELRSDFTEKNLLAYVRDRRPHLVRAALTILRAYFVAGKPDMNLTPWGSFEGWSSVVRGAVVFAGLEDPGAERATLATSTAEQEALASLLMGLEALCNDPSSKRRGVSAAELVRLLTSSMTSHLTVRDALVELIRAPAGQVPNPRQIGYLFRKYEGRVVGGRRLHKTLRGDHGEWSVERVDAQAPQPVVPGGDGGDGGDPRSSVISAGHRFLRTPSHRWEAVTKKTTKIS